MLRVPSATLSSSRSPAAAVSAFAIPSAPSSSASSTHSISPALSVSSVSTSSSMSSSASNASSSSASGPRYVTHAVLARGPNSAAAALAIVSMGDIVLARSPAGVEYAIVRSLLVDATGSAWFRRQPLVARVVNSSMQFFPASSPSASSSSSSSPSPSAAAGGSATSAGESATWEPLGLIVRVVYSSNNSGGNPPSVNVASVPGSTRTPSPLVPQAQVSAAAAAHGKPSASPLSVVKDVAPGLGSRGTSSSLVRAPAAAVNVLSSPPKRLNRPPAVRGHVTPALPIALMNPTLRRLSGLGSSSSPTSSSSSSSSSSTSATTFSAPLSSSPSSISVSADSIARFHPYTRPASNSPNSAHAAAAVAIAAAAIRRLPTPTPSPASTHDPLASRRVTTPLALGPPAMVIPTSPPTTPAGSASVSLGRARSWSQTQAPTSALAMPALTASNGGTPGRSTPALVIAHDRVPSSAAKSAPSSFKTSAPSVSVTATSPEANSPLVLRPTTPPPFQLTEAALTEPASTAPRSLTMSMTIVDPPKPPNKYTRPANFVLPHMPAAPICPRTSGPGSLAYIVTTSRGCLTEIAEAVSAEEEEEEEDMEVDVADQAAIAAQSLLQLARAPVRA